MIFYYESEGYVPCVIDFVLRIKNSRMSYWYPRYEEFKGINSDENNNKYIEFSIMTSELEGLQNFDLEFVSTDELRYQKSKIELK